MRTRLAGAIGAPVGPGPPCRTPRDRRAVATRAVATSGARGAWCGAMRPTASVGAPGIGRPVAHPGGAGDRAACATATRSSRRQQRQQRQHPLERGRRRVAGGLAAAAVLVGLAAGSARQPIHHPAGDEDAPPDAEALQVPVVPLDRVFTHPEQRRAPRARCRGAGAARRAARRPRPLGLGRGGPPASWSSWSSVNSSARLPRVCASTAEVRVVPGDLHHRDRGPPWPLLRVPHHQRVRHQIPHRSSPGARVPIDHSPSSSSPPSARGGAR